MDELFEAQVLLFTHDCLNGHAPVSLLQFFTYNHNIHDYATRSNNSAMMNEHRSNNLFIPFARTTNYGLKSIKVIGPRKWNVTPRDIRNIAARIGFKIAIKKYLLSRYNLVD